MQPKTFQELMEAVMKILPGAEICEDTDGQIVIYSDLEEKPNGRLEKFTMPPE